MGNCSALPSPKNNLLGFSDSLGHILPKDAQNKIQHSCSETQVKAPDVDAKMLHVGPREGVWWGRSPCLGCSYLYNNCCKTNSEDNFHFMPFFP